MDGRSRTSVKVIFRRPSVIAGRPWLSPLSSVALVGLPSLPSDVCVTCGVSRAGALAAFRVMF